MSASSFNNESLNNSIIKSPKEYCKNNSCVASDVYFFHFLSLRQFFPGLKNKLITSNGLSVEYFSSFALINSIVRVLKPNFLYCLISSGVELQNIVFLGVNFSPL